MSARVVVHGAENFVGRRLLQALAASQWATPVAVRTADVRSLQSALADAVAVAHCVGGDAASVERGATTLYGALASLSATPRVVHLSSMTVYGSVTGTVDEHSATPADLGPYAHAQRSAEARAAQYRNRVILRPGAEYGPDCSHWSGRIARLLQARRLGDLGPAGDGYANLVFIDDLLAVFQYALRQPGIESAVFNVALAEKPTWNDYLIAYGQALGAVPVQRIPARRLRVETRLLAVPLKVTEIAVAKLARTGVRPPLPITRSMLQLFSQEIVLDVARIEQAMGIRWTPLAEGLQRAAASYRCG